MGENLGQHFLQDETVIDDVLAAGSVSSDKTVLEIGPGKGVLTKKLLSQAKRVVAVEKDPKLAKYLRKRFAEQVANKQLIVKVGDIRDFSFSELITGETYSVVANIPYYLTSELIEALLTAEKKPDIIALLVQKEVAQRIVAQNEKHSRLSLFVHAYANPKLVRSVKPEAFSPPPNVDSAILAVSDITDDFFTNINADDFFELIRAGFQHKRKTIRNNLKRVYDKKALTTALNNCDINPKTRPERLELSQWRCLHKKLK